MPEKWSQYLLETQCLSRLVYTQNVGPVSAWDTVSLETCLYTQRGASICLRQCLSRLVYTHNVGPVISSFYSNQLSYHGVELSVKDYLYSIICCLMCSHIQIKNQTLSEKNVDYFESSLQPWINQIMATSFHIFPIPFYSISSHYLTRYSLRQ
jgi:hypothetical protein